jgi:hypothetical protein
MEILYPYFIFFLLIVGGPVLRQFVLPLTKKFLRERRYRKNLAFLLEHGKVAQAKILNVAPGERINRAPRPIDMRRDISTIKHRGKPLMEKYYTSDDSLEWLVTLNVSMSYLTDVEVKKAFVLTRSQYMQMVPDKTIDVAVDPADPQTVEIIWAR